MDRWKYGQIDKQIVRQMEDGQMDRLDGQIDGQRERKIDGWKERYKDRQIDK